MKSRVQLCHRQKLKQQFSVAQDGCQMLSVRVGSNGLEVC